MVYLKFIMGFLLSVYIYYYLKEGVSKRKLVFPNNEIITLKYRPYSYLGLMFFFLVWEVILVVGTLGFLFKILT
jgi:hypothetical protein